MSTQVEIKNSRIPHGWSYEAADFVNQWIKRKKFERLGHRGIHEVKNHPWLRSFDWKGLYEKTLTPSFIPPKEDNYDSKMNNHMFRDSFSKKSIMDAIEILEEKVKDIDEIQELFKDYYYDYREKPAESKPSYLSTMKDCKTATKPQTL